MAIAKKDPNELAVEFVPFGAVDKIRLSAAMVKNFIAVPTKSGALPSDRDCIKFLMLCRGKRANPFEGDCYLIGYDTDKGPSFSMVCGVDLFLKRAEQSGDYDGYEAGVIVAGPDGLQERKGSFLLDDDQLLGAWCKVYRKNHAYPTYKTVKFSTYDTGKSRWAKDPGGQIVKVAVSQAHREAYPTPLGGLYTQEEMQRVAESGDGAIEIKTPITMPLEIPAGQNVAEDLEAATSSLDEPPAPDPAGDPEGGTIQGKIEDVTTKRGQKGNKPWVRFGVKLNGGWYNTFDAKLGEKAERLLADGAPVVLHYEVDGQYRNVVAIEAAGY